MSIPAFDHLLNLQKHADEVKAKLMTEFKEKIEGIFSDFFRCTPEIKEICWTQYTPYFNDGDECIFSVHDIVFIAKTKPDGLEPTKEELKDHNYGSKVYEDYPLNVITHDEYPEELRSKCCEFSTLLYKFTDEFKYAFGDHAFVTVTKEGIDVDEYDHD